jgi:hypothetical protein
MDYTTGMSLELISRSQLVKQWTTRAQELRAQGEDITHLQRFLQRVDRLPGQTVGDLFHAWCLRQSEERPTWTLALMVLCALAGLVAWTCGGAYFALVVVSLIGGLGFCHYLVLLNSHEAFSRELIARAEYAL